MNPDEIPLWAAIPTALILWTAVIIGALRDRKARR